MALTIKNTPILEGKASERFNRMIANTTTVISKKRILSIKNLTEAVLSKKKD